MDVKEITNAVSSSLRNVKERMVADNPEDCQPLMTVYFFRDDDIMAMMMCLERDKALATAWLGASGFAAQAIGLASEAWAPLVEINPDTGQRWNGGEPAAYAEKHGIGDVVGESLVCSVVDRAGNITYSEQKFRQNGSKVEWLIDPEITLADKGEPVGYIPDVMLQAMKQPTLAERIKEDSGVDPARLGEMFELSPERQKFHMDMAVIRQLVDRQLIVGMILEAEPGSERAELIEERMEEGLFNRHDLFGGFDG